MCYHYPIIDEASILDYKMCLLYLLNLQNIQFSERQVILVIKLMPGDVNSKKNHLILLHLTQLRSKKISIHQSGFIDKIIFYDEEPRMQARNSKACFEIKSTISVQQCWRNIVVFPFFTHGMFEEVWQTLIIFMRNLFSFYRILVSCLHLHCVFCEQYALKKNQMLFMIVIYIGKCFHI